MRLFLGIPVSKEVKEEVIPLLGELRDIDAGLKTIEPDNLHFTLKFLDDVDERVLEEIKFLMKQINFKKFFIDVKRVGSFSISKIVKVLWVGVDSVELTKLTKEILVLFNDLRKEDYSEIINHLTVARVKTIENQDKIKTFLSKHQEDNFGKMLVDKVILYESVLTPKGPTYREITKVVLL